MEEPTNPDKYFIYSGPMELDGKKGIGRVKKWYADGKSYERVLDFHTAKEEDNGSDAINNTGKEK